jgi:hypothetical protein
MTYASQQAHTTVAPERPVELCVWMLSGVLNYRLCDRDLDCEHCPLDRALRGIEGPENGRPPAEDGKACPRAPKVR